MEDIKFGVKKISNGKAKDIKSYQGEILKIGRHVLLTYTTSSI